jgi:NAD(P)H-quinone oxidoreductase subunit 5
MDSLFAWTITAPALMLLAAGLIPRDWANEHLDFMRRLAKTMSVAAAVLAVVVAVGLAFRGPIDVRLAVVPGLPAVNFGVYFDDLAAIMLLLISFIGAVICRYAVRYLDGDPEQGAIPALDALHARRGPPAGHLSEPTPLRHCLDARRSWPP